MSIQIGWDEVEGDTLHWTLEGLWTWAEVLECACESRTMIETRGLQVYMVVEHRHAVWLPGAFNAGLKSALDYYHPNTIMVLIATQSIVLHSILYAFNLFTASLPFPFQFVEKVEQAQNWITENRVSNYVRQTQPR